jgi:predicted outer membrane repeat protein
MLKETVFIATGNKDGGAIYASDPSVGRIGTANY